MDKLMIKTFCGIGAFIESSICLFPRSSMDTMFISQKTKYLLRFVTILGSSHSSRVVVVLLMGLYLMPLSRSLTWLGTAARRDASQQIFWLLVFSCCNFAMFYQGGKGALQIHVSSKTHIKVILRSCLEHTILEMLGFLFAMLCWSPTEVSTTI